MNESKFFYVLGQLRSWETGYVSPSCQMAIKDAVAMMDEMADEINDLKNEIEKLKKKVGSRDVEF